MTMRAPESRDPSQVPRCSEGRGAVVLDGLMTVVHGLVGVALLSGGEEAPGAAFLLAGGLHLSSAVAGNGSAKRCTKAHEAHAAWRRTPLPAQQSAGSQGQGAPGTSSPAPAQTPATQPAARAQPAAPAADQETQANPWADFWVTQ